VWFRLNRHVFLQPLVFPCSEPGHYKEVTFALFKNAHRPFNQYWAMPEVEVEVEVEVAYLSVFLHTPSGLVAEHLWMLYFFCVESGSWFLNLSFRGLLSIYFLLSRSVPLSNLLIYK